MNFSRQCQQTQFLSMVGFGNKMKLKSRLLPFSLICISFCFQFCSHLPLSTFGYTLTVRLGILGHSKFHVWDHVLYQLTGNYHSSVWQDVWILASLIWRLILLPDMGSLGFGFRLIIKVLQKSMQNFIHRQGATDYKVHGSDLREETRQL